MFGHSAWEGYSCARYAAKQRSECMVGSGFHMLQTLVDRASTCKLIIRSNRAECNIINAIALPPSRFQRAAPPSCSASQCQLLRFLRGTESNSATRDRSVELHQRAWVARTRGEDSMLAETTTRMIVGPNVGTSYDSFSTSWHHFHCRKCFHFSRKSLPNTLSCIYGRGMGSFVNDSGARASESTVSHSADGRVHRRAHSCRWLNTSQQPTRSAVDRVGSVSCARMIS